MHPRLQLRQHAGDRVIFCRRGTPPPFGWMVRVKNVCYTHLRYCPASRRQHQRFSACTGKETIPEHGSQDPLIQSTRSSSVGLSGAFSMERTMSLVCMTFLRLLARVSLKTLRRHLESVCLFARSALIIKARHDLHLLDLPI